MARKALEWPVPGWLRRPVCEIVSRMEAFSQYLRKMRWVLHRRGRKREEIEDLMQDAFVRLLEYCETGAEVRQPEALLVTTVQRLSLNFDRDEHRDLYSPEPVERLLLVDSGPTPDEMLAAEERMQRVKRILDGVGRRTREIFFLHRLDGLSYAQIGQLLSMPPSTVRKHVARAMTVLLDEMHRESRTP
jgi:RNA polymerase sigma factor (sigma-70 family)